MADGTPITTATGTETIATDDIAGVKVQRVKVGHGVDGSYVDASATNPLPVTQTGGATETTLAALLTELGQKLEPGQSVALDAATLAALESITVSGTVALDTPTLAALESITVGGTVALDTATLAALENTTVTISGTVPVSGPLTDAQLRATAVPVSGTFYPATQPVSGTLGVSSLPGSPAQEHSTAANPGSARLSDGTSYIGSTAQRLHVDDGGSSLSVDDGGGSLTVDGTVGITGTVPVSGVLTDNQLRATPVPVSLATAPSTPVTGTFWQATQPVSGPLTDTQLRATPVPVSQTALPALAAGSNIIGQVREVPATLAVTTTSTAGATVTLTLPLVAGQFHYITRIEIELYATAARTGAAAPVIVTTTNLPGGPAWDFETAQAIGTMIRRDINFATPLRSSAAATATTIVAPVATSGIWRINAFYYTAA